MSYIRKVEQSLDVLEKNPEFNTDFLNSMIKAYHKYNSFTTRQKQAIDNIYTKFKIEEQYQEGDEDEEEIDSNRYVCLIQWCDCDNKWGCQLMSKRFCGGREWELECDEYQETKYNTKEEAYKAGEKWSKELKVEFEPDGCSYGGTFYR